MPTGKTAAAAASVRHSQGDTDSSLSAIRRRQPAMGWLRTPGWRRFSRHPGQVRYDVVQMCCLVIVHQTPTLPTRLPEISPWVDTVLGPPGRTHQLLAAQTTDG